MKQRCSTTVLLAGCVLLLAGCPRTTDTVECPAPGSPTAGTTTPSDTVPGFTPQVPLEPSVRYFPLDAPEGCSQAVIVQGLPLVHTRQLLPLDAEGKLVGEGSAEQQVTQVLENLKAVLEASGSGLGKLVRLGVYANSPATVDLLRKQLAGRVDPAARPAISAVVSPLPQAGALVAIDAVAVAVAGGETNTVARTRCDAVAGDDACADAAVLPPGPVVYLSGQPSKLPVAEAATESLTTLLGVAEQLKLQPQQVVQLKVFVQPIAAADQVMEQIRRAFPDQLVPPVSFVEWIASAPVEIEMVVHLPPASAGSSEAVEYYTPPGVKPSPTFSRAALVHTPQQIYISGLAAAAPGDGQSQVRDVFEQLKKILDETGSDLRHLVKATYYVSANDAATALDKLRPEYYDPARPPAASKVTVHGVGHADRTLSMDMIAVAAGP